MNFVGGSGESACQSVSVVVPVFNGAGSIAILLERLMPILDAYRPEVEVILVNDASTDNSSEVISRLVTAYPDVRGIDLMRNYGQHNALLCGIRAAQFDIIVTLDDDLEHPPEEIPRLIAALEEGVDVVYGRPIREQHGLFRNLASRVTKLALATSMGVDVAKEVSAFRVFRTQVRDSFAQYHGPFVSIDVLLTWGTTRFSAIKVQHDARSIGESNYTLRRLLTHALNMATGFSVIPLQVASILGLVSAVFGMILLLYVVGRYVVLGGTVPGFPFLASIISLFAGVQLIALGVIGEYLARMHFRLMDRPAYVARQDSG